MSFTLKKGFTFGGWLPALIPQYPSYSTMRNDTSHPIENVESDEYGLFQAYLAGIKNASIANPNPSVGCVVIKNNKIISIGCTEKWGSRHAERVAFAPLSAADLEGSRVYVSLEPCTHMGRQPPCIHLFENTGIKKVVIGCEDPNPVVTKNGIRQLQNLGIGSFNSYYSNEIKAWNYPFFIQQKEKRPFIALKWAQSLDGCLADDNNGWKWISGEESRTYAHWLRQKYDAIMVGIGTVLNDFPSLDIRNLKHPELRNPLKIIYDPEGKIFECSLEQQENIMQKTFSPGTHKVVLINANILNNNKRDNSNWHNKMYNNPEIHFLTLNYKEENILAKNIFNEEVTAQISEILNRPLQSILIEGGSRLLSSFIHNESFDVIHLFIAPFFLGGEKHKLFSKEKRGFQVYPNKEVALEKRLHIAVQEKLGNDILIEMIPK
ncbi:bifunctional diaminohydroxyphosphoribosylaminopyrimidine deaminase/5-amino-6-(5-phosphoribosylamino)uracil reductase RibD [Silvanigrella aquatica]|uniref:Riboflavin biosynthesis protein RibD n=1 Tax=Silvanigrella aquatica TaxID=1915309 RepID=A0A1L4D2Q5_9BACT|nr:bifunctional diaminohydroxyphosphoribosylaminopyrimidine deaminase/5-amino-6-(5-phosphoribosylamino)uracil reductase RibD [Silvanigrella aquatica]APJ04479.1 riboflavin biosynthesis protein RibD [Silvanigrella aquatica]